MLLFLLLLRPFNLGGEEPDWDFHSLEKLEELQKTTETQIYNEEQELIKLFAKKELEKIQKSKTYTVLLKRNSLLIHLQNQKTYKLPEEIYVKIHRLQDAKGFYYISLPQGGLSYKVAQKYVVQGIEETTFLAPLPQEHKEFVKEAEEKAQSKLDLSFFNSVNVHLEHGQYQSLDQGAGNSLRLENLTYFQSFLPIELGPSLSFQKGGGISSQNRAHSWTAFYLGPHFRIPLLQFGESRLQLTFGIQKSFSFKISREDMGGTLSLSSKVFQVGTDLHLKNFLPGAAIGFNYRRQWMTLKGSTGSYFRYPAYEQEVDHSVGVSIGYGWGGKIL